MAIVSSGQLSLTDLNDSKQIYLYLQPTVQQQIYTPNAVGGGVYSPDFTSANLIINPQVYIAGGDGTNLMPNGGTPVANSQVKSITWYEGSSDSGTIIANHTTSSNTAVSTTDYTVAGGSPVSVDKKLTVKTNFTAKTSQAFTCKVVYIDPDTSFDVVLLATKEIVKITNGSAGTNAITAIITNDSHSIPTDVAGGSPVYTGSGTEVWVYDGATTLAYDGTGTANGTFNVTAVGTSITVGAKSDGGSQAIFADHSAITADTAKIVYTIAGKRSDGTAFSVTKTQTFNKTKAGGSPTLYRLIPSTNAIQQNVSNVFNPTTLTVSATSATGTASPVAYAGRFEIWETTDGTNWGTVKYTSSANESSKTWTPSGTTVKGIKAKLFLAGGVTTLLDEQIIPVVKDGATGIDAYFLNVNTPNGDTIRNGQGEIVVNADLYKGSGIIAPTATQWYVQDVNATTVSGGNVAGGNGWRLIKTVANPTASPTNSLQPNAGSTSPVGTYYVKYTWCGLSGETIGNTTETSYAVTAGNDLKVTIPAFGTDVVKARVYAGLTTGVLKYQGDITVSAGNLVLTKLYTDTEAIPTVSTASISSTATTITVRNWAIQGVEGIKCVATSGTNYSGVVVVRDLTDPIMVVVEGDQFFKNGQGSVILKARLLQDGTSIPTAGYTFAWSVYNSDNSLNVVLSSTTDTATVLATQVNGKGYVVCDAIK